ncbi:putative Group 1 glycosyl transferase [Paraburkholderia piptadeniae]|uniref:Glycosyltransferase n=2 Tax=Paraburkholderia TaxID=1822464 RepID=A0A7X1NC03_9BURK|nr:MULTISPECIES: glycosyltransferase [Paraburkholderia]MPW18751.1 glycosyltransferase [Paraburkholderia franconis]SIT48247.1 putative Group 1 glycosyl transferase [Paraburkholderia piptadeniae]
MKVLQVIPTLSAGGAETLVAELALALTRRGHQVGVALLAGVRGERGAELADKLEHAGVWVSGRTLHSMRRLDGAMSLARTIRSLGPDVMHSHLYAADVVLAAVNALTVRQRLIRTIHSTSIQGTRSRAGTWLLDRLYATSVACGARVADAYADYFRGAQKSAVVTVRNGVARAGANANTERNATGFAPGERTGVRGSLGIAPDAFVFVHVGTFHGRTLASSPKAHDILLKAFAQLCSHSSASRTHLLLIGDGCLRESAQRLAQTLGIDGRVTFAGVRDNVPQYLAASDAFVFPSRYEGLPVALIEACMAGVPTIASDLPEVAEVFGDLDYLAARVDEPSDFASAMLDCLANPTSARARAHRTAAHVALDFSIDLCAAHYELHYERLGAPLASRIAPQCFDVAPAAHTSPSAHSPATKQLHQENP